MGVIGGVSTVEHWSSGDDRKRTPPAVLFTQSLPLIGSKSRPNAAKIHYHEIDGNAIDISRLSLTAMMIFIGALERLTGNLRAKYQKLLNQANVGNKQHAFEQLLANMADDEE